MTVRLPALAVSVVAIIALAPSAAAQYLWISVDQQNADQRVANIYFEEAPAPGDGHYLDHFLGTSDVWLRTLRNPNPEPIRADEVKRGGNRWMRTEMPAADEYSIDAYGQFGVYQYGKKHVLLHYYARHLRVASHDAMHELGRAEQMDLDLVPHDSGDRLELTLRWNGEPVADRMVFIRGPKGFRKNIATDDRGTVVITPQVSGRYRFRSSVEFETPGREDGQAYQSVRHNVTLLMTLPLGQ